MGTETRAGTGSRWLDIKTGQEIRALRPDERLSDALEFTEEERSLRLDRYLVGRLTGKWRGAEPEKRAAMIVGDAASAGYLVPAPLAAQLIDLARKQSVVMRAGAQTIPMSSGQLSLAKVVGDPTAYWYADEVRTAGLTESSSTFGRLNLYSRTLAILERASVELAEDAPNFGTVLSEQIAKALALELDRGVLFGIAQQGWDGLRQWSDLNEISMGTNGAHLTTYAQFVQAVQKVLEGNYPGAVDQLTAVMAPRTWSTIEQLTEATTNSPLRGPDSYNRLQKMVSTQLPITEVQGSAVDASTIFVGDFSQVAIGVRTDVNLEFTREGGDAFTRLHTLFRGYLRADWTVLQSKFLTRIVGVTVA